MCGIAGIVSLNPSFISGDKLKLMSNAIAHRGPDGDGFWINDDNTVSLSHRRLKIIDLSAAAAQPMHYLSRYTITYNGEIYNYIELKDELKLRGYHFTTQSDTEVILAAYDCWKENCLQYFDGMFAFALWDAKDEIIFCARDRFGEKPFYFHSNENTFLFASEMKSLWAAGVPKQVNSTMLLNYLTIGYVQNAVEPQITFYKNIYALPPAHYISLNTNTLKFKLIRYWDLDKESVLNISYSEVIEKFSDLLKESVRRRMRSDVALGTSLSGGLDSSSIVGIMQALNNVPLKTFSAVFPAFEKDESKYIKAVADKFHIENFCVSPTAESFILDIERLIYFQEEPFQSASIYAQYKVYELAKIQDVKVILDGQGADETLAGYHKYYHWYWQELLAKNKFAEIKRERKQAKELGVKSEWGIKNYFAAWVPEMAAARLKKNIIREQIHQSDIAIDFLKENIDKHSLVKPIVRKLNDILYFNTCQLGLSELLRYADRNSMAHGREVRLPFLNHELVQFIFSLPTSFKIHHGWSKWILRKSVEQLLPPSITWRKDKIGYEPPQKQWMHHQKVQDIIYASKEKLVKEKILKNDVLQKSINPQNAHDKNNCDFKYLCAAMILK